MIRATTPTHNFTFPENVSTYSTILITYAQNGKVILEKEKSDLVIDSTNLKKGSVTLTQEETNLFDSNLSVKIQIRAKVGTTVMASAILNLAVRPVLNDEEL